MILGFHFWNWWHSFYCWLILLHLNFIASHVACLLHASHRFKKVRVISGKNDDGEENRSLRRLRQEVEAIMSASDCPQIVRFYGLTFHEVTRYLSICTSFVDSLYRVHCHFSTEHRCSTLFVSIIANYCFIYLFILSQCFEVRRRTKCLWARTTKNSKTFAELQSE